MMSSCATSPGGAGLPARWRSHALDRRRDLLSESLYWCIIRLEGGRERRAVMEEMGDVYTSQVHILRVQHYTIVSSDDSSTVIQSKAATFFRGHPSTQTHSSTTT